MGAIDQRLGRRIGVVDDMVLRRNDGLPAYNLTTVVDDAANVDHTNLPLP